MTAFTAGTRGDVLAVQGSVAVLEPPPARGPSLWTREARKDGIHWLAEDPKTTAVADGLRQALRAQARAFLAAGPRWTRDAYDPTFFEGGLAGYGSACARR